MAGKSNLLPFAVAYDPGSKTSTILDRLYRPIVVLPGRFPRCDYSLAIVPEDAKPLYGVEPQHKLYRDDGNAAVCDPVARKRLRSLIECCGILKAELRRRERMQHATSTTTPAPTPTKAAVHADLVASVFGDR